MARRSPAQRVLEARHPRSHGRFSLQPRNAAHMEGRRAAPRACCTAGSRAVREHRAGFQLRLAAPALRAPPARLASRRRRAGEGRSSTRSAMSAQGLPGSRERSQLRALGESQTNTCSSPLTSSTKVLVPIPRAPSAPVDPRRRNARPRAANTGAATPQTAQALDYA